MKCWREVTCVCHKRRRIHVTCVCHKRRRIHVAAPEAEMKCWREVGSSDDGPLVAAVITYVFDDVTLCMIM